MEQEKAKGDNDDQIQGEEEKGDGFELCSLKLVQIRPSLGECYSKECDEDNDGFRTPTSREQRVALILRCPPAPRKPKSLPLKITTKRKSTASRRLLLDLSTEMIMNSFFPQALLEDFGAKIKKVKRSNPAQE